MYETTTKNHSLAFFNDETISRVENSYARYCSVIVTQEDTGDEGTVPCQGSLCDLSRAARRRLMLIRDFGDNVERHKVEDIFVSEAQKRKDNTAQFRQDPWEYDSGFSKVGTPLETNERRSWCDAFDDVARRVDGAGPTASAGSHVTVSAFAALALAVVALAEY